MLALAASTVHGQAHQAAPVIIECPYLPEEEPTSPPSAWDLGFVKGPPGGVWWIPEPFPAIARLFRNGQQLEIDVVDFNEAATALRIPTNATPDDNFQLEWSDREGGITLPIDFEIDVDDWPIAVPVPSSVEGYTRTMWVGRNDCGGPADPGQREPQQRQVPFVEVYWGIDNHRNPYPSSPPDFLLNAWLTPSEDEPTLKPDDRLVALREPFNYRKQQPNRPHEIMFRVDEPGRWTMTLELVDVVTGQQSPPVSQTFEVSLQAVGGCSSTAAKARSSQRLTVALVLLALAWQRAGQRRRRRD